MFQIAAMHKINGSGITSCMEIWETGRQLWVSKEENDVTVFENYSLQQRSNITSVATARLPIAKVIGCEMIENTPNETLLYVVDGKAKQLAAFRLADSLTFRENIPIRGLNSPIGISRTNSTQGHLHVSDGRNRLYSMNLNTGQVEDSFLEINDRAGDSGDFGIGALQLVGDYLVAMNTKADNELLLIDTSTSRLAGQIDLNQLFDYMNEILQQDKIAALEREKSISAIAWDSKQKTLFVVGLDWPFIFELKFSDRTFARKPVKNHNGKSV